MRKPRQLPLAGFSEETGASRFAAIGLSILPPWVQLPLAPPASRFGVVAPKLVA